ncbi:MAG: hypothetical protein GWO81_06835 [Verrucomicrobia bacterium]|nr:hypothetical protein [Verrucomicrobiota bacterium]
MFTCKQVSKALHKEDYAEMSTLRRCFLKLHVHLCVFCGKFNTQVIDSQDMCRCYKDKEAHDAVERPKLNPSQKEALKELISEQAE